MGIDNLNNFESNESPMTYQAKRPNIQILGPDGKPMSILSDQELQESESRVVSVEGPQAIKIEEPKPQVMEQPLVNTQPVNMGAFTNSVPNASVEPEEIYIEEPKPQVMEQPVVITQPVNGGTFANSVPNVSVEPEEIYIEEPKPQVVEQPVVNTQPVNMGTFTNPVPSTPEENQPVSNASTAVEEVSSTQNTPPAVNPALRGFTWAQPQNESDNNN